MYKKGSMTTLLVVALLALGVMTFMSFKSDATGAFSGQSFNLQTYAIPQQPQTTGSDVAQVQLQCYIWKYDHPNVQAPVEIAGLCASFGVTV
jgi:uncharacterized protein YfaQ (DUF2300 family)